MMTNGKKLLMPRVSYNTLVGTNVTIVIIRERDKVMEALKIKIRDGFFSGTNKVNLESATKTKVVGNGWVATIEKDGTIKCRCIQKDSNGETIVRFALYPNGYSKLTIKEGNNPVKVLVETFSITKNHKVENGEIYRKDETIPEDKINQITDLAMFKEFISDKKWIKNSSKNIPDISGIIYINNTEVIKESELRNTIQVAYPNLTIFCANVE